MTKEALKLALEALETLMIERGSIYDKAITAIKEALANEALDKMAENARELGLDYEPAQRTWVGLTDEEIWKALSGIDCTRPMLIARAIEAKLKDKNAGR